MHKRNVLTTGSVRNELERVVLFQRFLWAEVRGSCAGCVCATLGIKADICEFLSQNRSDGSDEFPGDCAIASRTPDMRANDETEEDSNVALELEVRG